MNWMVKKIQKTVKKNFIFIFTHSLICLILVGCAGSGYVRALPDIDRANTKINSPLIIIIDNQINDDIIIPGFKNFKIQNYRQSLADALKETFRDNFTNIEFKDSEPSSGIYLRLKHAKPIQVQYTHTVGMNIQYRFAIGSDGEERAKVENLTKGNYQASNIYQIDELLKNSIEIMCEDIYNQIFRKKEHLAVFTLKGKQYEISTRHGKQRIAVINFKSSGAVSSKEALTLTDTVRTGLIKTDLFDVVTNDQIDEMIKLQEVRQVFGTDCESKNCQINLGKALECKYLIIGNINHAFNQYSIAVKILNVSEQRYLHAEEINVTQKNQLPAAARKVVDLMTGKRE